ncbi:MAG: hypothetical protein WA274_13515 [Candidatus Acidiferrales bacterium]
MARVRSEERVARVRRAAGSQIKPRDRLTHEFLALGAEKSESSGVGFPANPSVVKNHNGVEGAVEDGLELAFGRVQNAGRFAVRAAGQQQKADVDGDSCQQSDKNEREQHGSRAAAVGPRHDCGNTKSNDGCGDDQRCTWHPSAVAALAAN